MSDDDKLVDVVRDEFRIGFKMLCEQIGQTNARLDHTNARLDKSHDEMRSGFNLLAEQIGETNTRLDEFKHDVTEKIGQTNVRLDELNRDVAGKLDGIASFLIQSENHSGKLASRLDKVERRVEKLEKRDKSA